ncbi:flagellar filament capping protein FliD [uncultured Thioclava sp.]|uniref:flagellar filament capping protein FliD n=1 Tax=uncultured Thioclava sp. TaxID=473858 RepID=UPI0025F653E7|nr:flagellar filament capping protein FliD [uncultured Thioclava sp.]
MSNSISNSLFSSAQVNSIVSRLQSRIQAPMKLEQYEITTDKTQISALGQVRGALSSLNGALGDLTDPASLSAMKASTSASSVATATAADSAASGAYTLSNIQLAQSQEIYSASYASASAAVGAGSGTLTFQFGSGGSASVSIASSADTVSGVADAINAANTGVTATVVNTASGVRLALQGAEPGSGKSFSVSGSGAVAGLSYGSGSATMSLGQSARNATFTLNGVPVSETSNDSVSLVKGLSVDLVASGSTKISVDKSHSSLSSALSSFTNKLNDAVDVIATQTAYQPGSSASAGSTGKQAKSGPLLGNVQVQQLKQDLLSAISSAASGGLSSNALGFSISSSGALSFDTATFDTLYGSNPTGADSLIKSIETHVGSILTGAIGTSVDSGSASAAGLGIGSGFIGAATSDLNTNISSLQDQIKTQTKIGNEQIANLEAQFTSAISRSNTASTTLSYLSLLNGSSSSS